MSMLDFVYTQNVDMVCFMPVVEGYWRHHELFDGTYILDDLMDIMEVIKVNNENKSIVNAYFEDKAQREANLNKLNQSVYNKR